MPRPGSTIDAPAHWRDYEIPMEPVDLSSTFIRDIVESHENLTRYVPASVIPLFVEARG